MFLKSKIILKTLFFIPLLIGALSCKKIHNNLLSTSKTAFINKKLNYINTYNFAQPEIFKVTNSLREISGLSFYNNYIFTHNDEQGIIFKIDPKTGSIVNKIHFGKDADYEGIEITDNKAIVVKSNGDLCFYDFETEQLSIKKNKLKTANDVEGLCLKNTSELLIACKGETLKDDSKNREKAIYSYNLQDHKLNKSPFLNITDKEIEKHLEEKFNNTEFSKKELKKLINRATVFSPSGIAIHPKTNEIYIISAKESLLLIFSAYKKLKEIIFLNKKQLPQPEGICFDNNTNLYISTEVEKGAGKIYKYAPK